MTAAHYLQIVFLVSQGLCVGLILLFLFGLRHKFGIAVLYITLGVFQYAQTSLASFVYFEIAPDIHVSPGSAVLFTASLFTILLIYIREDVAEARKLIYGIIIANLVLSIITLIIGFQIEGLNKQGIVTANSMYLIQTPRILLSGSAALIVDLFLIIIAYEILSKYFQSIFILIYSSMAVVLVIDTLIFSFGSFWGQALLSDIIVSGIIGKLMMALVFASMLTFYLKRYKKKEHTFSRAEIDTRDIFSFLTYRQKYEILREEVFRDSMTGLFNRGFLNETLTREVESAIRTKDSMAFLMIDIDHFKRVNDNFGHQQGDHFIQLLANVIAKAVRQTDVACRYGGEEFSIISPRTDIKEATLVADRIRQDLVTEIAKQVPPLPCEFTITIGIATVPQDADTAGKVIEVADKRMYRGKLSGRDCTVGSD